MYPQVTQHFAFVAKEWHFIFPGFGYVFVVIEDMVSQEQQTTFHRFIFLQVEVVYIAEHGLFLIANLVFHEQM